MLRGSENQLQYDRDHLHNITSNLKRKTAEADVLYQKLGADILQLLATMNLTNTAGRPRLDQLSYIIYQSSYDILVSLDFTKSKTLLEEKKTLEDIDSLGWQIRNIYDEIRDLSDYNNDLRYRTLTYNNVKATHPDWTWEQITLEGHRLFDLAEELTSKITNILVNEILTIIHEMQELQNQCIRIKQITNTNTKILKRVSIIVGSCKEQENS